MASRRFFPYADDDYYYTIPYNYPYHTARYDDDDAFFFFPESVTTERVRPVREPSATVVKPKPSSRPRSVSIPVHFDSESELHVPAVVDKRRELSAAEAAVRVQAAARGFTARRMVREVRAVEREAESIATRVAAMRRDDDARVRLVTVEELMRLLLRLDAVRGARDYRRRVIRRVIALQDAVDALERRAVETVEGREMGSSEAQHQSCGGNEEEQERMRTKKVVEALCEQSAQQGAVIGALVERVETLERALRQVEERRRRKKMIKLGKGCRKPIRGFYSD